jgi:hypothetical protein
MKGNTRFNPFDPIIEADYLRQIQDECTPDLLFEVVILTLERSEGEGFLYFRLCSFSHAAGYTDFDAALAYQ